MKDNRVEALRQSKMEHFRERLRIEREHKAQFLQDLAEKYDVVGNPKVNKCFEIAWEYGHSAGYMAVESYFMDLVELIK